jgi:hypothetical protein
MPTSSYRLGASVPLPRSLNGSMIARAVESTEVKSSDVVEVFYEQRNAFSTIVGIYGAKALASLSPFEPNPHRYRMQGAFPDLRRRGSRGDPPAPVDCLESKASIRPWAVQAHYDHDGWYVIWRYLVDESLTITGRPVVVWRVHVAFINKVDWKYEGSTASAAGGGRTHTFGVREPAKKFGSAAVYERTDIVLLGGKPTYSLD